jgi:hypothetical protein
MGFVVGKGVLVVCEREGCLRRMWLWLVVV